MQKPQEYCACYPTQVVQPHLDDTDVTLALFHWLFGPWDSKFQYLIIGVSFKRFVPQAPYFKQHCTKAPHITGNGVLFEVDCLKVHEDDST